jgi:hypothetical protein
LPGEVGPREAGPVVEIIGQRPGLDSTLVRHGDRMPRSTRPVELGRECPPPLRTLRT